VSESFSAPDMMKDRGKRDASGEIGDVVQRPTATPGQYQRWNGLHGFSPSFPAWV